MTSLFDQAALTARYQGGEGVRLKKHQKDAIEAHRALGDAKEYLPLYLAYFKRAAGLVDLSDLVGEARKAREPGKYFLEAARNRLGIKGRGKIKA